jgi:hypothetical protein
MITNVNGELIKTLVDMWQPAGTHKVTWNAVNGANQPLSSGTYFYRMKCNDRIEIKKMLLVR